MLQSTATILSDFIDFLPDGAKLAGAFIQPVDLALEAFREAGSFFTPGVNHFTSVKNPNIVAIPSDGNSSTAMAYTVVLSDETIDSTGTTVFPKERDVAGVPTALTGQRATIHYLFVFGSTNILQMGQTEFSNAETAIAAAGSDLNNFDFAEGLGDAVLLAQIVIGNAAVDFVDNTRAQIINTRGGGSGGNVTTTFSEEFNGFIEAGADKTYTITQRVEYPRTIDELTVQSVSGTISYTVNINGTPVTGISGVAVSSTEANAIATALNSVVEDDKITLVAASNSSAVDVSFTLKSTRV